MLNIKLSIVFSLLLLASFSSFADETISFKGIRFGMNAEEIAKLGGGNTEYGCAAAIKNLYVGNQPWTYGGIDSWTAICIEDYDESKRVPGISGLITMIALVHSHNNSQAKWLGNKTYSVEELVDIFSKVFGKFDIETKVVKNGLGQEFIKKDAKAIRDGAVMNITENKIGENHEDYINLKIVSLDYLTKENEWEKKKASEKLKDAKSDF